MFCPLFSRLLQTGNGKGAIDSASLPAIYQEFFSDFLREEATFCKHAEQIEGTYSARF